MPEAQRVEVDFEERVKAFKNKFRKLTEEFEVNFAPRPMLLPDGRMSAEIMILSTREVEKEPAIIKP